MIMPFIVWKGFKKNSDLYTEPISDIDWENRWVRPFCLPAIFASANQISDNGGRHKPNPDSRSPEAKSPTQKSWYAAIKVGQV
jgi:hypothetical protein